LTGGDVGIGNTTPQTKLDVAGGISGTALLITGAATFASTVSLGGVTYTFPTSDGSASGRVLKTDSAGQLSWSSDINTTYSAGEGLVLNGSLFVLSETVTGSLLHASATLASSGTLVVEGTSTLNDDLSINADNKKLLLGAAQNASIYYDGTDMQFDSDGEFSFSGTVMRFETSIPGTGFIYKSKGQYQEGPQFYFQHDSPSPANNDVPGAFVFSGNNSNFDNTVYADISALATNVTDGSEAGELWFSVNDNGAIGTQLKISKDTLKVSTDISLTTDNSKVLFGATQDASIYYDETNMIINPKEVGSGYLEILGTISGAALNVMGNVGIGTGSPSAKLEVSGGYSDNGIILSDLASGDTVAKLYDSNAGAGRDGNLSLYDNGVESIRLNGDTSSNSYFNTGNVGIGLASPTTKLEVLGTISGSALSIYGDIFTDGYLNSNTNTLLGVEVAGAGNMSHSTGSEGWYNTGVGNRALYSNTTGYYNTANGYYAAYANTTGIYNTAIGSHSLRFNESGNYNTALGGYALRYTTGHNNSAIGYTSLMSNTSGANNVAQGFGSLYENITGSSNVAIGYNAGRFASDSATGNETTGNSTYVGYYTKSSTGNVTNENVFGYNAIGIGSNSVVLGNDSVTTTALKGNVGIGTTAPSTKLEVAGTMSGEQLYISGTGSTPTLYTDSGKVGIGTDNPLSKLHIDNNGTFTAANGLMFGDGNTGFYETADNQVSFYVSGSTRFALASTSLGSSSVGGGLIRTTSSEANPALSFAGDTDSGLNRVGADSVALTTGGTDRLIITSAGDMTVGGFTFSDDVTYSNILANTNHLRYDTTDTQYDHVWSAGQTQTMKLNNGTGYLGIGSADPQEKLDLEMAAGLGENLRLSSYAYLGQTYSAGAVIVGYNAKAPADSSTPVVATTNGTVGYAYMKAGWDDGIQFNVKSGAVTADDAADNAVFEINYDESVRLLKDDQKLLFGASQDASIYYDGDDMVFDSQEVGTGDFYFKDGNVGIHTINPVDMLEIAHNSGGSMSLSTNGLPGSTLSPKYTSLNFLGYLDVPKAAIKGKDKRTNALGGDLIFYTADAVDESLQERVTINRDGLVSIANNMNLERTDENGQGVIYKDGVRFLYEQRHSTGDTARPNGNNLFMGRFAGNFDIGSTATSTSHGSNNVGLGGSAGVAITTGYNNMLIGYAVGGAITSGANNVGVGIASLGSVSTGAGNVGLGYGALNQIDTENYNVAIGYAAGINQNAGAYNVMIGRNAGRYYGSGTSSRTGGNYNTLLGDSTRASAATTSSEIVIGYNAVGLGANSVVLGADTVTDTYLKGDIGIGVTSGLSAKTTIYTGDAYNNEALLINTDETTGTQDVFKIISDVASTDDAAFRITANGSTYSDNAYSSAGADYAEWFKSSSSDGDLLPGDVVCIDVSEGNTVKRCERNADANVMGIVSTNPAFIGNNLGGAEGLGIDIPGYVLVGLIGQVPAKVLVEQVVSGTGELLTIRPGDALTSASRAGYARRALPGEPTVGVALEGFSGSDGSEGTVNVLISRRNSSITVDQVESKIVSQIAAMEIEDEVEILVSDAVAKIDIDEEIDTRMGEIDMEQMVTDALTSLGDQVAESGSVVTGTGETIFASQLMPQIQSMQSLIASLTEQVTILSATGSTEPIENLDAINAGFESLHSSAITASGSVNITGEFTLNGITIDAERLMLDEESILDIAEITVREALYVLGDITIEGLSTFMSDVMIRGNLTVTGSLIVNQDQAGYAMIPMTGTSVTIEFTHPFTADPIVTASSNSYEPWRVSDQDTEKFTIELADPAPSDITFSWHVLATEEAKTTIGDIGGVKVIEFPVDTLGYPLSSSDIWNSCIRNQVTLDLTGQPFNCSRYHEEDLWTHPDLMIEFIWDPGNDPKLILQDGYIIIELDLDSEPEEETPEEEEPPVTTDPV
ncbi:hypothetical protein HN378_04985, partial [Candidatus Peregrinibacteria bacterium]|nr:hypothetical protein [Candidatus Peregrinibacteria bacterium]